MTEGLGAVLIQVAEHGERIALLDNREADHFRALGERLQDIGTRLTGIAGTQQDHGAILANLEGVEEQVTALADRLDEIAPADDDEDPDFYRPARTVQWWRLEGPERDEAVARLTAWVNQVYKPVYGHFAAGLGRCWAEHVLCLTTLDWLAELHLVLYLRGKRTTSVLAGQAEFATRLLPAAAEIMAQETARCSHSRRRDSLNGARR